MLENAKEIGECFVNILLWCEDEKGGLFSCDVTLIGEAGNCALDDLDFGVQLEKPIIQVGLQFVATYMYGASVKPTSRRVGSVFEVIFISQVGLRGNEVRRET